MSELDDTKQRRRMHILITVKIVFITSISWDDDSKISKTKFKSGEYMVLNLHQKIKRGCKNREDAVW